MILKPVFIITIVAVAMIGMMTIPEASSNDEVYTPNQSFCIDTLEGYWNFNTCDVWFLVVERDVTMTIPEGLILNTENTVVNPFGVLKNDGTIITKGFVNHWITVNNGIITTDTFGNAKSGYDTGYDRAINQFTNNGNLTIKEGLGNSAPFNNNGIVIAGDGFTNSYHGTFLNDGTFTIKYKGEYGSTNHGIIINDGTLINENIFFNIDDKIHLRELPLHNHFYLPNEFTNNGLFINKYFFFNQGTFTNKDTLNNLGLFIHFNSTNYPINVDNFTFNPITGEKIFYIDLIALGLNEIKHSGFMSNDPRSHY